MEPGSAWEDSTGRHSLLDSVGDIPTIPGVGIMVGDGITDGGTLTMAIHGDILIIAGIIHGTTPVAIVTDIMTGAIHHIIPTPIMAPENPSTTLQET